MVEDATIYRSKEQVLYDLSKALHFSPESLEANRKGQLSKDQVKQFSGQCIRPAALTFFLLVGPLAIWTWITAARQQLSFDAALPGTAHRADPRERFVRGSRKVGRRADAGFHPHLAGARLDSWLFEYRYCCIWICWTAKWKPGKAAWWRAKRQINRDERTRSYREIFFLLAILEHAGQSGGLSGTGSRLHLHRVPAAPERDSGLHRT